MNKLFVDAVNTPINKIIERIKLRPTTYMTIKTVKKANLLLLVRYSRHVFHIADAQHLKTSV